MNENNMAYFDRQVHWINESAVTDMLLLLEFVERWNKQDKESNVSEAAQRVTRYLTKYREITDEENGKEKILDNLTGAQESKLEEAAMKDDYTGSKDEWENYYERWLEDVTLSQLKAILGLWK